jgi:hypothetical protein
MTAPHQARDHPVRTSSVHFGTHGVLNCTFLVAASPAEPASGVVVIGLE